MPASGLTPALIHRRTKHGGSATSDAAIAPPTGSPHFTPGSTVAPGISHAYPSSTTSGTVAYSSSGATASAAASAAAAKAAAAARARQEAIKSLNKAQHQIAKIAKASKPPKMPKTPKLQSLKAHPQQAVKLAKALAVTTEKPHTPGPVDRKLLASQKGLHKYVATVHALPHAALPKATQKAQAAPKMKVSKAKPQKAPQKASAAKLTKTKPKGPYKYAYPFSKGIQIGRTDMGIDPVGTGKVRAISKAKVIGTPAQGAGSGWPNEQPQAHSSGAGIVYKVLKGPLKGKKVYTYEGPSADTSFKRGDILKRGQVIGKSVADFETGLAHGAKGGFAPVAHNVYTEGMVTKAGTKFKNIVAQIKANPAKVSAGGGGVTTHKIPAVTGPLNKDQKVFAGALAKETGLSPKVTAAWTLAEGGSGDGSQNWLNIGVTDSGRLGVSQAGGFSNPVSAAKLTAKFIKGQWGGASSGIQAIQRTAGKSPQAQLAAIANSGWASNPNYAGLLNSTMSEVGAKGSVKVSVPVSTSTSFTASGGTTSGGTTTTVSGAPTASGTTSASGSARSNRARLLAEVNRNRKKAAAKIGTYRSALTSTSSTPSSSSSSTPSTSSSSGSIKLGL